jgi:hypothetical protein
MQTENKGMQTENKGMQTENKGMQAVRSSIAKSNRTTSVARRPKPKPSAEPTTTSVLS